MGFAPVEHRGWTRVVRRPMGFAPWDPTESVDGWPMAITIRKTLGGQPKPVPACGRDGRLVSSCRGAYVAGWAGVPRREPHAPACGPSHGQLSGGNRMARGRVPRGFGGGGLARAGCDGFGRAPDHLTNPDRLPGGPPALPSPRPGGSASR